MSGALAITAWSVVSPFGLGQEAFAAGLAAGQPAAVKLDPDCWDTADERAAVVPGFDARRLLGRKGTRGINRVCGLAAVALDALRDQAPPGPGTGLVLGTTAGSAQTMMETIRAGLVASRPYLVDPVAAPYGVINGTAGYCAAWYGLRGPNVTVAAGRTAGLVALNYARRLLLTGRAETVLAGAAEEYSRARSWLEHHAPAAGVPQAVLGEGCVVFALSVRPGATAAPLAEVLALEFAVCDGGGWEAGLRTLVGRALDQAGLTPSDVQATLASGAAGPSGQAEEAVLAELPQRALIPLTGLIGETHAASAAFQVAAVLALPGQSAGGSSQTVVITSTDPPSGMAAAAVLRCRILPGVTEKP